MFDDNWSAAKEIGLPDDLRSWVGEGLLVTLVLSAVQSVCEPRAESDRSATSLPAGLPRTLLTLLSYSYASGISASEEIQNRIPSDFSLRYLSAGARPTWHDLRRFRRQNRSLVEKALGKTFELAWECTEHEMAPPRILASDQLDLSSMREFTEGEHALLIASAAVDRIDRAVIWDSMALDV